MTVSMFDAHCKYTDLLTYCHCMTGSYQALTTSGAISSRGTVV